MYTRRECSHELNRVAMPPVPSVVFQGLCCQILVMLSQDAPRGCSRRFDTHLACSSANMQDMYVNGDGCAILRSIHGSPPNALNRAVLDVAAGWTGRPVMGQQNWTGEITDYSCLLNLSTTSFRRQIARPDPTCNYETTSHIDYIINVQSKRFRGVCLMLVMDGRGWYRCCRTRQHSYKLSCDPRLPY